MNIPKMMFFHDGRHNLIYMYEPPMQKEEYASAIDELAGSSVEAVMFGLAEGRVLLHDTKVGEIWGHNIDKWPHMTWRRTHQNVMSLIDNGHDPLRVVCDRAHEKGMLLFPSFLAQVDGDDRWEGELPPKSSTFVRCSNFRFDNRHLEIGAKNDLPEGTPGIYGLDFAYEEVRNERFSIIEEVINEYPIDGFELNLNNSPYYFHPDNIKNGTEIMTQWIEKIYSLLKSTGTEKPLVIRIPADLEFCKSVGLDPSQWIKRNCVDVLVGEDALPGDRLNQMADFRPLVSLAKGSSCQVHAAVHSHFFTDRISEATIEVLRAAVSNYWSQGIDGLYMARGWFQNWPYEASFYEKIRELPFSDIMQPKDKYYRINTPMDNTQPIDRKKFPLPVNLTLNKSETIEFDVSDDLHHWNKVGRVHEVVLRLALQKTELDSVEIKLNGQLLPDEFLRKINQMFWMIGPRGSQGGYWYIYKLTKDYWPILGKNKIEVELIKKDPDVVDQKSMLVVELETKYLMGQNFRKGFNDPDLGMFTDRTGGPF